MSLERRLGDLEKLCGRSERPIIYLYVAGSDPPLSDEEKERLIRKAMERNPGQPMYCISVPPRGRGEDAS